MNRTPFSPMFRTLDRIVRFDSFCYFCFLFFFVLKMFEKRYEKKNAKTYAPLGNSIICTDFYTSPRLIIENKEKNKRRDSLIIVDSC